MKLLAVLFSFSFVTSFAQSLTDGCILVINERRVGLPQVLIEKQGALYSFAHQGDSVLENSKLGLTIEISKGLRGDDYATFLSAKVSDSGLRIAKVIYLRMIYFDYNSTLIRNDASAQLDQLTELMLFYPFAEVQAIVHTDSRGSHTYNLNLANRRANSIRQYLTDGGVNGSKLIIKISGEEELVANCPDQQSCDELLHQANRRAEFIFNPLVK